VEAGAACSEAWLLRQVPGPETRGGAGLVGKGMN